MIPQEVEDFKGGDKSVAVTIHSLESRVWCEVTNGAETLASGFKSSLTISDSDKKFLKSTFRFESKRHCFVLKTVETKKSAD